MGGEGLGGCSSVDFRMKTFVLDTLKTALVALASCQKGAGAFFFIFVKSLNQILSTVI